MEDRTRVLLEGIYTKTGFTLDNVPFKTRHTDCTARLLELEPTFHVLLRPNLPYGTIPAISQTSHISFGTLQRWRKQLLLDSSWRTGK
jgi:hypothetical protein